MIKSKRRFDTTLILFFLIFILSFVIIGGIVKDSIYELSEKFNFNELFKTIFWCSGYLILLRFFYINNTKIIVDKKLIEFKNFINNRKYKPEEIDYYIVDYDFANRFTKYETLFLVKDEKIIERISSFDYANYDRLKRVFDFKERKEIKIHIIQKILLILGFNTNI